MVVLDTMRLDKWLWCARFYKTRGLAAEEVAKGRVLVNGNAAKPAKDLRPGDNVVMRHGPLLRTVTVRGLSGMRGPAPVAQALYEETPDSILARERAVEQRRLAPEPADTLVHGRPTKRDRRSIEQAGHGWNERWSASVDD
ncbi:RNA-binding S4 domain-containing protein [Xylophilus sp. Leaf220]|jgi:ribosome-associated heat shock protein Hsp15|uniref:RNA-binding S4 domain-containing protein n=1 Tax=Xylophilus sp. Leaf220 TaxID=1735686 RepID=UPI0006F8693B|nr:RNA-binding S4 domain-containing protein [Xylophilus sp. Leaf220]KQM80129.1 RNA-binding protein [Xylophilus sp. Leaf220]